MKIVKTAKLKGTGDIYKFYRQKCKLKQVKPKELKLCTSIWNDFNLEMKRLILEDSEELQLPYRLGSLRIRKRKIDQTIIPENKRKIDWGKTKKLGYKVFYTNDYIYNLRWERKKAIIRGCTFYTFKTCWTFKRDIAKAVLVDKRDYFS